MENFENNEGNWIFAKWWKYKRTKWKNHFMNCQRNLFLVNREMYNAAKYNFILEEDKPGFVNFWFISWIEFAKIWILQIRINLIFVFLSLVTANHSDCLLKIFSLKIVFNITFIVVISLWTPFRWAKTLSESLLSMERKNLFHKSIFWSLFLSLCASNCV